MVLEVGSCDVVVGVVGEGGGSTTLHLAAPSDMQVMIVSLKLTNPLLKSHIRVLCMLLLLAKVTLAEQVVEQKVALLTRPLPFPMGSVMLPPQGLQCHIRALVPIILHLISILEALLDVVVFSWTLVVMPSLKGTGEEDECVSDIYLYTHTHTHHV